MNLDQSRELVRSTFEHKFDKSRFISFIKNLIPEIEIAPFNQSGTAIKHSFADYISHFERIGKYADGSNKLDVLIVYLKQDSFLSQARSMQRNFISYYLNGSRGIFKDAALVAFVSPNMDPWRFSLVKMEYKQVYDENKKKIVVEEKFTHAKRWSYMVGSSENTHTAKTNFSQLLQRSDISLEAISDAFDVEIVSEEFFKSYRDLFINTKEYIDAALKASPVVEQEFREKQINSVDFAKKLLGQIVFLYFLQKKGWLGAKKDIGEGDRCFITSLFNTCVGRGENFYNDYLKYLFYDALNNERRDTIDPSYYKRFDCKIPFLNGGLFEALNNHDWQEIDLKLPNEVFSSANKVLSWEIGTGILDVFSMYNFTVKEDEPLEKEVAIDPELLGKAYERFNAIRVDNFEDYKQTIKSGKPNEEMKFNKLYGVFYTPREVVHYMCQQALIQYLYQDIPLPQKVCEIIGDDQFDVFGNDLNSSQLELVVDHKQNNPSQLGDIELFIKEGYLIAENDYRVERLGKETAKYQYKLPESIRNNARGIDIALSNVKICDPAVGSGAFPVGMMFEIVQARELLSKWIEGGDRSHYQFKRECIENSLYGVDIDSGAVEIAKLRLWLSLIVDEDDIHDVKPLPNLDYKIVCANSLFRTHFITAEAKVIEKLKKEYLSEKSHEVKIDKKRKIDMTIKSLFSRISKGLGYSIDFDFPIVFSELYEIGTSQNYTGGFDIVIGNPPYVRMELIKELKPLLCKMGYKVFDSSADLYTYFYEQSLTILKDKGTAVLITSNKWLKAKYGTKLRQLLKTSAYPLMIIDFSSYQIFKSASVNTNIILFRKTKPSEGHNTRYVNVGSDFSIHELDQYVMKMKSDILLKDLNDKGWSLSDDSTHRFMSEIEAAGTPLKDWDLIINRGIISGLKQAFNIDKSVKAELCTIDPDSQEVLKPIISGRDINRYWHNWDEHWLIKFESRWTNKNRGSVKPEEFVQRSYPAVYAYLYDIGKRIEDGLLKVRGLGLFNRGDKGDYWWELRDCTYYDAIEKPKIIWADIAQGSCFSLDLKGLYIDNTVYFLSGSNLHYLLGVLNSKVFDIYFAQISASLGAKANRGFKHYVEQFPIPKINDENKTLVLDIENEVKAICGLTSKSDYALNKDKQLLVKDLSNKIDSIVYRLYGLSDEAISCIEEAVRI